MCITTGPAIIHQTRVYGYIPPIKDGMQRHICGYQNRAETLSGPNCMLLNFAGSDLRMVKAAQHTRSLMADMTRELPELVRIIQYRGGSYGARGLVVENYGDYTVILAHGAADILSALAQVPDGRRPARTSQLEAMVGFYLKTYPDDSLVLACFNGKVEPTHPITVSYVPRDPEVITIPGLDGHDGELPTTGSPVTRNFHIAFGIHGVTLPFTPNYNDRVNELWVPKTVTGFFDNRDDGPNGNYVMPIEAITTGLSGRQLAEFLSSHNL